MNKMYGVRLITLATCLCVSNVPIPCPPPGFRPVNQNNTARISRQDSDLDLSASVFRCIISAAGDLRANALSIISHMGRRWKFVCQCLRLHQLPARDCLACGSGGQLASTFRRKSSRLRSSGGQQYPSLRITSACAPARSTADGSLMATLCG